MVEAITWHYMSWQADEQCNEGYLSVISPSLQDGPTSPVSHGEYRVLLKTWLKQMLCTLNRCKHLDSSVKNSISPPKERPSCVFLVQLSVCHNQLFESYAAALGYHGLSRGVVALPYWTSYNYWVFIRRKMMVTFVWESMIKVDLVSPSPLHPSHLIWWIDNAWESLTFIWEENQMIKW